MNPTRGIYGIRPGRETQKMLIVFYFCLGVQLALPDLALRFFLIQLGIEVSQLGTFYATLFLPWCAKPLYGMISDRFPLWGLRRKPYIIISNLGAGILWVLLFAVEGSIWGAQVLAMLTSICTCFADVMYDSILVEQARLESHQKHGIVQSWCWAARAAGALVASFCGGVFLRFLTPRQLFLIEAAVFFVVAILSFVLIDEQPCPNMSRQCCAQLKEIWHAIQNPHLWKPAIFVFVFSATPSSYAAFFYYLVEELKFSTTFLGILTMIRHGSMIVGNLIYGKCLRNIPYRKYFFILVLSSAILGASPILLVTHWNRTLGISDNLFTMGDDLFLSVVGQIALMPILVLAAKLCPKGIEAST